MEKVLDILSSLLQRLEVSGKLLWLIAGTIFVWVNLTLVELTTHQYQLMSISKRIEQVENLGAIAEKYSFSTNVLRKVYNDIVEDLAALWSFETLTSQLDIDNSVVYKGFAASAVWIVLLVWTVVSYKKKEHLVPRIRDLSVFIVLFFIVGAILPIIFHPFINYVGIPLVLGLTVFLIGRRG